MESHGKKPPRQFIKSHLYVVQVPYSSWFDQFHPGEQMVYIGSAYSRYDNATGFFFYDIASGKMRRLDTSDTDEMETLLRAEKIFEDKGPDMLSGTFKPGRGSDRSDLTKLFVHGAYFKRLVEGADDTKSWFQWLEENASALNEALTRADLLRFKFCGFESAKSVLDAAGETYQESPRFGWISQIK